MCELRQVLEATVESLDRTAELFYKQKTDLGYQQLEGTLDMLSDSLYQLESYPSENSELDVMKHRITNVLNEALQAMETKDTTLLADLFEFELKEILKEVIALLK
jgi:hypothetical protein